MICFVTSRMPYANNCAEIINGALSASAINEKLKSKMEMKTVRQLIKQRGAIPLTKLHFFGNSFNHPEVKKQIKVFRLSQACVIVAITELVLGLIVSKNNTKSLNKPFQKLVIREADGCVGATASFWGSGRPLIPTCMFIEQLLILFACAA